MELNRFRARFQNYKGEPQQDAGVDLLYAAIKQLPGSEVVLAESAPWAAKFSEKKPQAIPPRNPRSILLKVEPEYQNDNLSGRGYRECFSSSCAMLARFEGKIGSDDEYNKIRARFGDTTDSKAQLQALRFLGLKATLSTNASVPMLENVLLSGKPAAVGWFHRGNVSRPGPPGVTHWSVGIGFDPTHFIHNDPNGEADMVNGGYVKTGRAGAGVRYSRKNWLRRWNCTDSGIYTPNRNGWMLWNAVA